MKKQLNHKGSAQLNNHVQKSASTTIKAMKGLIGVILVPYGWIILENLECGANGLFRRKIQRQEN